MWLKLFIFIIALTVLSGQSGSTVNAQQSLTLEDCIRQAQKQNISIKRQDLQIRSSKSKFRTTQAGRLPSINAWASHNLNSGRTVNIEDYSYTNTQFQNGNIGIQGDMTLFGGFEIYNAIKQEKFIFQAAIQESAKLRNSIALQVTSAFLQVLFAEELLAITREQCELSNKRVESTQVFFEQGKVAHSNLLEMQAQRAQDILLNTKAQSSLENARILLANLMNLPDVKNLKIVSPMQSELASSISPQPVEFYILAAQNLPRMKGAELRLKASESALAASKGLLSPKLAVNGMIYSRYSDLGVNPINPTEDYLINQQLRDNSYRRLALNINIPVFNQLQTNNLLNQAKIAALDAKLALDQEKNSIKQEILQAYTDAQSALAKYDASQNALESTQLAFSYTKERYDAGLATSIEYMVSKNQLLKIKSELLQAKYELILKNKILKFYQGTPIT
ncbi:MAG: TolC family protein [Bacteroidales bacterium]|nr:TolC family protein [Bacteroidales bacterium]